MSLRILSAAILLFGVICGNANPVTGPKTVQLQKVVSIERLRQDGDGDGVDGIGDAAEAVAGGADGFTMIAPVLGQMITGLLSGNFAQVIRAVPGTILDNQVAQAGVQTILNAVAQPLQNFVQYTIRQGQMFYNVTVQRRTQAQQAQQAQQAAAAALAAQQAAAALAAQQAAATPVAATAKSNVLQVDIVPVNVRSQDALNNSQTRQEGEDDGESAFTELGNTLGGFLTHILSGNIGPAVGSVGGFVEDPEVGDGVATILKPVGDGFQNILMFGIKKGQQYFNVTMKSPPSLNSTTTGQGNEQRPVTITVESPNFSPVNTPATTPQPTVEVETTTSNSGDDEDEDVFGFGGPWNSTDLKVVKST